MELAARRLSRNFRKSSGLKDEQVTSQKESLMNSVTKSIILTALAGSLAISEPAPASAFSRGGGGFHGGGFQAGGFGGGMRGFGGGHMFTGRSVARGGAFAGRGYGGIGAYGGYGGYGGYSYGYPAYGYQICAYDDFGNPIPCDAYFGGF
jgi:hypothetical protein